MPYGSHIYLSLKAGFNYKLTTVKDNTFHLNVLQIFLSFFFFFFCITGLICSSTKDREMGEYTSSQYCIALLCSHDNM